MQKLVEIREAHFVQVKGELAAAEDLAGRQASAGEAQDRLNLLRELAGSFRRTQTEIEEEQENLDDIESEYKYREEFNFFYYNAMGILEKLIVANNQAKPSFPARGTKRDGNGRELREAMCQLLNMQRAWMEQLVANSGATFSSPEGELSSKGNTEVTEELINNNKPDLETEGDGAAGELLARSTQKIDVNLLQQQILNDSGDEVSKQEGRDQEEVPKLHLLTPSDQIAAELSRNRNECFIVQQRDNGSKQVLERCGAEVVHMNEESKAETGNLLQSDSLGTSDCRIFLNGMLKVQQARKTSQPEDNSPNTTGFYLPEWTSPDRIVFHIRLNKWHLMHDPTSEFRIRWKVDIPENHHSCRNSLSLSLISAAGEGGFGPTGSQAVVKGGIVIYGRNVNNERGIGLSGGRPDDRVRFGINGSHPDDDAAVNEGGITGMGVKHGLRLSCLKAGEDVLVTRPHSPHRQCAPLRI